MRAIPHVSRVLATAFVLATASAAFAADGGDWTVHKSSGEVWLTGSDVQQASLKQEDVLKPGDTVRTGRTGRVLLKRGDEMILVSPNSVVGVPAEKKDGLSTTIKQQAGSILLDVEKRNVKHFEVETPYLAAVVKGTRFRVTVTAAGAKVEVVRGQVEVAQIFFLQNSQFPHAIVKGTTTRSPR
jgi:ferric-dicitrate binding protein FerR (iron transport regulator)